MLAVPAYAKINLALEVIGRRVDGFHELDSLVSTIDWHDLVTIDVKPAVRTEVRLRLAGPACAGVPHDQRNLAVGAALSLAHRSERSWHIQISIEKRLPAEAGLGGGSADAAAVLRGGAQEMTRWGVEFPEDALVELAEQVGSDVPSLLRGGTLRLQGRGERLMSLPLAQLNLVVTVAGQSSTAATFAAGTVLQGEGRVERLIANLKSDLPFEDSALGSSLEAPAISINPGLAVELERLRREIPEASWHLTGSGGAVFSLVPSAAFAIALAQRVRSSGFLARACRTVG